MIARELGSSAIPVREALCQLVGRDILVERRNKGFFVAPMTSAILRALYAAHGQVLDQILQRCAESTPLPGRTRNRWLLFAALAQHSQDAALIAMQHYLSGRLALMRRQEEIHISDTGQVWNISDELHKGNFHRSREMIDAFHLWCQKESGIIWKIAYDR